MKYLVLLLLFALVAASGCRKSEVTPKSESFVITGTPDSIYEAVRPRIQKLVPSQTEIVRIDNASGMILRFSIQSPLDGSVRLVEVILEGKAKAGTRISIGSEKFSFIPKRGHDSIDSSVEVTLAKEFKNGG